MHKGTCCSQARGRSLQKCTVPGPAPPGPLGPFCARVSLSSGQIRSCLGWQTSSTSCSFWKKEVAPLCSAFTIRQAHTVKSPLCRGRLEAQNSEVPSPRPHSRGRQAWDLIPAACACRTRPFTSVPCHPRLPEPVSAPWWLGPACPGPPRLRSPLSFALKPFFRINVSRHPKHFKGQKDTN